MSPYRAGELPLHRTRSLRERLRLVLARAVLGLAGLLVVGAVLAFCGRAEQVAHPGSTFAWGLKEELIETGTALGCVGVLAVGVGLISWALSVVRGER